MNIVKSIVLFVSILSATSAFAQAGKDCKALKHATLRYVDNEDKTAYIVIDGNKHTEYLEGGKYYIKSDLTWINDCEYDAKMTAVTLPDFPFGPGEVMHVRFDKIENGIVTGVSTIRGKDYPAKFKLKQ